jgi:hypothetical protein
MNTNEAKKQWQEDEALKRFQIISPLLEDGIDSAKKQMLRENLLKAISCPPEVFIDMNRLLTAKVFKV